MGSRPLARRTHDLPRQLASQPHRRHCSLGAANVSDCRTTRSRSSSSVSSGCICKGCSATTPPLAASPSCRLKHHRSLSLLRRRQSVLSRAVAAATSDHGSSVSHCLAAPDSASAASVAVAAALPEPTYSVGGERASLTHGKVQHIQQQRPQRQFTQSHANAAAANAALRRLVQIAIRVLFQLSAPYRLFRVQTLALTSTPPLPAATVPALLAPARALALKTATVSNEAGSLTAANSRSIPPSPPFSEHPSAHAATTIAGAKCPSVAVSPHPAACPPYLSLLSPPASPAVTALQRCPPQAPATSSLLSPPDSALSTATAAAAPSLSVGPASSPALAGALRNDRRELARIRALTLFAASLQLRHQRAYAAAAAAARRSADGAGVDAGVEARLNHQYGHHHHVLCALLLSARVVFAALRRGLPALPAALASPARLLLAGCVLAEAQLSDFQTRTASWATAAGIGGAGEEWTAADVAGAKRAALDLLQFDTGISAEEYALWMGRAGLFSN
ncbi:hypothetical protein HK405_015378 [Cladochytrium tenue]|nr:hypothetical protein HK405_015378 [Cladochytrium tenue]